MSELHRIFIRVGLVLFLLVPFLSLFSHINLLVEPNWAELLYVLKNTVLQAFLSATFSLLLGLWGAFGILWIRDSKWAHFRAGIEVFFLLPNILPTLFVLLSCLNILSPFPFGIMGISLVHTILNVGLVSVILSKLLINKLGGFAELCWVEGASSAEFIFAVLLRYLKNDLLQIFFFVFILSFTSFAIPLVVGGDRGTTIEVLIYEKIRINMAWGQALGLSLIQILFLFSFSFFKKESISRRTFRDANLTLIHKVSGLIVPSIASLIVLLGLAKGSFSGWTQLMTMPDLVGQIPTLLFASLLQGLGVGVLILMCLLLILYATPNPMLQKFLTGYVSPSSALLGFAFLLIGSNTLAVGQVKIIICLSIVFLPYLHRLAWDNEVNSLQGQVAVAETLGAPHLKIWNEILLPQAIHSACFLAGLAAFWAVGDFAISSILAGQNFSLSLLIEALMSSYRLNIATALSLLLFAVGLVCFLFFIGVGYYVRGRKSLQRI